jgi:hypothetical protein
LTCLDKANLQSPNPRVQASEDLFLKLKKYHQ